MNNRASPLVVGIDPAPKKGLCACFRANGGEPELVTKKPCECSQWIEEQRRNECILLAWDAPLSFDPVHGFSDRPIDRATRAYIGRLVDEGKVAEKAVAARHFSGCPHWTITCHLVGLPFCVSNSTSRPFVLAREPDDVRGKGAFIIEVNPAVTLAAWWVDQAKAGAMPRYKKNKTTCKEIVGTLMLPLGCDHFDDDALDAYVAWRMGTDFLSGAACWVGDTKRGGYVLPKGGFATELANRVNCCGSNDERIA